MAQINENKSNNNTSDNNNVVSEEEENWDNVSTGWCFSMNRGWYPTEAKLREIEEEQREALRKLSKRKVEDEGNCNSEEEEQEEDDQAFHVSAKWQKLDNYVVVPEAQELRYNIEEQVWEALRELSNGKEEDMEN